MKILTVREAFSDYCRGDQITDQQAIAEVLDSAHHSSVVLSELPDPPPDDSAHE